MKKHREGSSNRHGLLQFRGRAEPCLTREAEEALVRSYIRDQDPEIFRRLVSANLPFVVKVARGYRRYGFPLEDLVQEGCLGLMRAIEKFDPDRAVRLITYAGWWIRSYIHRFILDNWSLVKFGTTEAQRRLFFGLTRLRRHLARFHDVREEPEVEAVAAALGLKVDEVRSAERRIQGRDRSLNAPVHDDDGKVELQDLVPAMTVSPFDQITQEEEGSLVRKAVAQAVGVLDERQRFIVFSRLMAEDPLTLREVGARFGVSRERARQLELATRNRLAVALQGTWRTVAPTDAVNGDGLRPKAS